VAVGEAADDSQRVGRRHEPLASERAGDELDQLGPQVRQAGQGAVLDRASADGRGNA
jgi:hypothetical protein